MRMEAGTKKLRGKGAKNQEIDDSSKMTIKKTANKRGTGKEKIPQKGNTHQPHKEDQGWGKRPQGRGVGKNKRCTYNPDPKVL